MASVRRSNPMGHPVVVTFLIFAIIAFMYFAAAVLKPLALAILLAFALAPLCLFLERRRVPRFLAAVLSVILALGVIGGIGYKVGQELNGLAKELPSLEKNVLSKLNRFKTGGQGGSIETIDKFVKDVSSSLDSKGVDVKPAVDVRVVNDKANILEELTRTVGPILETAGLFAFVLVLVLFILNSRDDLVDRLIRLFGSGKISLTTKTMDEVGHRISRYLLTFALVNSSVGVIVGLGLWAIGLPYALVWGVLAALLRFIPYAGPASAFALPFIFSLAHFTGIQGPLEVLGLFAVLEVAANSFLEPMIYGKTTGVSSLGLLVAAMFWTWLWGALGLLLSTPLTVCLAVLGKYVPALKVFATFLGEEAALNPDVRFYQRLLARDQDGASALADETLAEHPRAQVFDSIFVPTLVMAERDSARDGIDEDQRDFIWWSIDEIVQEIGASGPHEVSVPIEGGPPAPAQTEVGKVVGVPANDRGDLLALRMLAVLLDSSGVEFKIVDVAETPLKLVEAMADEAPAMILVSHVPPTGLTSTRYLVRRLRARFPKTPILVGRWADTGDLTSAANQLTSAGATQVVFSLADARDRILQKSAATTEIGKDATPAPARPAATAGV